MNFKAFCDFVGHTDLSRMTRDDAYRWVDHLAEKDIAKKSIREVWIASLRAVAGFQIERGKLTTENPFSRIRVRGVKSTKDSNKKGFSDAQAEKILTATLATFSHLTTPETRAARRWIPWICAYTGARVNEITSLPPSDVRPDEETGIWCIYLRPETPTGSAATYEIGVTPLLSARNCSSPQRGSSPALIPSLLPSRRIAPTT